MAKTNAKANKTFKDLKRYAAYLTVTCALLFGFLWIVLGITGANPDWANAVSNTLLVLLIFGAMAQGLLGAYHSIANKK